MLFEAHTAQHGGAVGLLLLYDTVHGGGCLELVYMVDCRHRWDLSNSGFAACALPCDICGQLASPTCRLVGRSLSPLDQIRCKATDNALCVSVVAELSPPRTLTPACSRCNVLDVSTLEDLDCAVRTTGYSTGQNCNCHQGRSHLCWQHWGQPLYCHTTTAAEPVLWRTRHLHKQ